MALVKLTMNGKRITAEAGRTVLEVAREHGFPEIPTLCNDEQLEPFASCFVCVVKVKGARTLVPACSTRVTNGMVVDTDTPEVRKARKAALELLLSNHYADCVGPCQLACPAGVDIQGYIALAALGKFKDAVRLIKEKNPLPTVCGRVCTRPCEVKGCRRSLLDEPVGIDFVKRYVTDMNLTGGDPYRPAVEPPKGKSVAVVGAGPAGLSCAWYLGIKGYEVTVLEALPEPGGMLRYGIPEYRLPKDLLDLEIQQILDVGVTLKTNRALGRDFTVKSLRESHDAVFLGIGAWTSSKMRVKDEETEGVLSGIDFLKNFGLKRPMKLHGRVLVVGGGNTAIDCARTALRCGADEVRIVYRRTEAEMPANKTEIHDAKEEGVRMEFLVAPTRVVAAEGRATGLECQRCELGAPDASGRRSPVPIPGSEFVMDADFILAAIGQSTRLEGLDAKGMPEGEALGLTRWQTIAIDEPTGETSIEGVFSGGDVVTGAATAIEAIAAGRKAAYAIDAYLSGGTVKAEPREFLSKKDTFAKVQQKDLRGQDRQPREQMPMLDPAERVKSFVEVETGLTPAQVACETHRCLECGCTALFDCDLRRYATDYGVDPTRFLGQANQFDLDRRHPLIDLDMNKCILCGRCVRTCQEVVGIAAYGFVNRGFSTVVAPALGGSLLDTDCVACGLCVATCPTGAIDQKVFLDKPGPVVTRDVPTVCTYCGVGCNLTWEVFGDTLVKVGRGDERSVTFGDHCRRGRFGYQHVHDRGRLRGGRVGNREVLADEAVRTAAADLKSFLKTHPAREVAVFVSPRLTNEEAYLAQKLARVGLKTHNVASLADLANPDTRCPDVVSTASLKDLGTADVVVVAQSVTDREHFTADLLLKRAVRAGARMVHVHPTLDRVGRLADVHLGCKEGTQAEVLAALAVEVANRTGTDAEVHVTAGWEERTGVTLAQVKAAAEVVAGGCRRVLLTNRDWTGPRTPGDLRLFAAAARSMHGRLLALREQANAQGLADLGVSPTWFPGYRPAVDPEAVQAFEKAWSVALADVDTPDDLAARLRSGGIRAALILGEDPLGAPGFPEDLKAAIRGCELVIVADAYLTDTAKAAHVAIPLATSAETRGTFTNSERRVQRLEQGVPPAGALEGWKLLVRLADDLGARFRMSYDGPGAVFDEIRRVVPMYQHVVLGDRDGGALWDDGLLPIEPLPFDMDAPARTVTPVPTLYLDYLESRFDKWFDGMMESARKRG